MNSLRYPVVFGLSLLAAIIIGCHQKPGGQSGLDLMGHASDTFAYRSVEVCFVDTSEFKKRKAIDILLSEFNAKTDIRLYGFKNCPEGLDRSDRYTPVIAARIFPPVISPGGESANGIGLQGPGEFMDQPDGKKAKISMWAKNRKGTILHEVGHNLGMRHEHDRRSNCGDSDDKVNSEDITGFDSTFKGFARFAPKFPQIGDRYIVDASKHRPSYEFRGFSASSSHVPDKDGMYIVQRPNEKVEGVVHGVVKTDAIKDYAWYIVAHDATGAFESKRNHLVLGNQSRGFTFEAPDLHDQVFHMKEKVYYYFDGNKWEVNEWGQPSRKDTRVTFNSRTQSWKFTKVHVTDVYRDKKTGDKYKFTPDGNGYQWQKNPFNLFGGMIAEWTEKGWVFAMPEDGQVLYHVHDGELFTFDSKAYKNARYLSLKSSWKNIGQKLSAWTPKADKESVMDYCNINQELSQGDIEGFNRAYGDKPLDPKYEKIYRNLCQVQKGGIVKLVEREDRCKGFEKQRRTCLGHDNWGPWEKVKGFCVGASWEWSDITAKECKGMDTGDGDSDVKAIVSDPFTKCSGRFPGGKCKPGKKSHKISFRCEADRNLVLYSRNCRDIEKLYDKAYHERSRNTDVGIKMERRKYEDRYFCRKKWDL